MSAIVHNLQAVRDSIAAATRDAARTPQSVKLVAVSKNFSAEAVLEAVGAGQLAFGESYVQEALEKMRRAVQLEPRTLRYVRAWADTALALCLYDEALPAMRRAAELADHEPMSEASVVFIPFLAHGSTREGTAWLAQMSPEQQQTPTILLLRNVWARITGDFAGSVALDRQQRYVDVFGEPHGVQDVNGALTLAAFGDRAAARTRATDAVSDLKRRLESEPANETFWSNLGLAYALLGDRAESLRCAQKAIDLVPESKDAVAGPNYRDNYAVCLAWLGDKDRAITELARLLRKQPARFILIFKKVLLKRKSLVT